jgi:hypothetical protein
MKIDVDVEGLVLLLRTRDVNTEDQLIQRKTKKGVHAQLLRFRTLSAVIVV